MASDIACGSGSPLFRRGGFSGNWSRGLGSSQYLIKQSGARTRGLLLASLAVPVCVFSEAGLADHFHHLRVHHAGNGVIQKQATARTIIVHQISQPLFVLGHDSSLRHYENKATYNSLSCPLVTGPMALS